MFKSGKPYVYITRNNYCLNRQKVDACRVLKKVLNLQPLIAIIAFRKETAKQNTVLYISKYKKVGVLPIRIVHRPFYISICISTLPMQHTTVHIKYNISICI